MSAIDPELQRYVDEWLATRLRLVLGNTNLAAFASDQAETAVIAATEVRRLLAEHRSEIALELEQHRKQIRTELEADRASNRDTMRAERGTGNSRTRLWVGGMGSASIIVVAVITWFQGRSKAELELELQRLVDDRIEKSEVRAEQRERRVADEAADRAVLKRDQQIDAIRGQP